MLLDSMPALNLTSTTAALLATELPIVRTKIYPATNTNIETTLTTTETRGDDQAVSCYYPTIWRKSAILDSFIDLGKHSI